MRKRIPTLLAIIVLVSLVGFGIFLQIYQKRQADAQKASLNPNHELVANLSQNSATVIWQTDYPAKGSVRINNTLYRDDRDTSQTQNPKTTHFVTVNDLIPNTNYQYEILNNDFSFTDQKFRFTTQSPELAEKLLNVPPPPPIRGSVINAKNEPETEAVVILNAKDLSPKATYLTLSGNFLLPLSKLTNTQTGDIISPDKLPATLEIRRGQTVSFVQISIPVKDRSLPAVTLGQNENLTALLDQPLEPKTPLDFIANQPVYDLNNDGKTNTLDSSLINDLIAKKQFNLNADFNNDKVIDEKDLELIKTQIR